MRLRVRRLIGRFLIVVLAVNGLIGVTPTIKEVHAQDRVIVINAEQPNVWTLEQAHYLLAQMHRRNLDLKAKSLEELDANEIAGLRFDVVRTLIELGVKFDDANRVSNRLLSRNVEFNEQRRQSLINRRNKLRDESLDLSREIARLEEDKARATTQEEKDRLTAEITRKTTLRASVDKEIEFTDNELKTLTAPSGDFKSTEPDVEFDPEKLPKSIFDDAFKDTARDLIERFNKSPRLNASLMLENFLQMQYEIIAKQLTLLRDEVGPGERLLFLELPQTVNVTHHEANKKWAQSWWKILGYTRQTGERADELVDQNRNVRPTPTSDKVKGISDALRAGNNISGSAQYVDLDAPDMLWQTSKGVMINNRLVRTVDLIPRQSSLNVNDMKLRVHSGIFSFAASFLFGLGTRLTVQRQREQFSQFVQQELYSSAFGKGSREFGWIFTPMPGTDRLLSGVRTTYAVVVVPGEATSLVLESNGCYFPRSAYQPNDFADTKNASRWGNSRTSRGCGSGRAFIVPIPVGTDGRNDFWVKGISYQPVGKGKRVVVLISGDNFSSQIGMLVNGVALSQSIGLAQPFIRDDSKVGADTAEEFKNEKIRGRIERIDTNKVAASFEMPEDFEGTPTLTLIAPGRAVDLNWLDNVAINGKSPATLLPEHRNACGAANVAGCITLAPPMFKGDPIRPLRIDSIEVFRGAGERKVTVLITGAGFQSAFNLYVNGVPVPSSYVSPTLMRAEEINAPSDERIQITISAGDKTIKSAAVSNPTHIRIDKVTVISYEPAKGKRPAVLVVRIEGSGFTNSLVSALKKVRVDVTSSSEAYLTVINPDETEVVTLTDPITKIAVKTVVSRKPPSP